MLNKLYLLAILSIILLCNDQLFAQTTAAPDGIIFQAVATDPQGNPASGRTIYIKDAILQSTVNGQTVYSETFKVTASNSGVFTIVIGKGQKISGPNSITNLDWTAGPYFLNIKAAVAPSLPLADWNADQQYIDMGTSQFWSVPFALYASNVAGFDLKLNIADTTNMLKQYLRKSDTASLSNRIDVNKAAITQEATRSVAAEALKANATDVATSFGLKENISNKSTTSTLGTSDVLYPTQNAVKTYVDATIGSATPDADATTKGKIQLAGDLGGTAASPTVPGLLLKANATDVTASLALKADASALATTNATVTSNKTATDASIATTNTTVASNKTLADATATSLTTLSGTVSSNKTASDASIATTNGNVTALTSTVADNKTAAETAIATTNATVASNNTATQTALNLKANIASPTFTGTVSGVTKLMVGLGNVDNISDVNKPVSTATQTALDLKEEVANKSTTTTLGTSDVLYPSQKAVKTYVDAQITSAAIPDADAATKGKLQLAGDLGGTGTSASAPIISDNAITTVKILDANVTDAKIATVSGSKINGNISGNADNVNGIVAVTNGGTGATTKTTAFDALSPMTTSGDILYGGASGTGTRLAKGTDGQILTLASGLPSWAFNSGVPYSGATASVDLGAHDLKVNGLTIGLGKGQNSENTAIGVSALGNSISTGSRNTAIGSGAMLQYVGTSFDNNTSVGFNNLIGLTTGAANTSVGGETMFHVGSASFNTAIGNHTLMNSSGDRNTSLGANAGNTVSTGYQNTLLGEEADVSDGTINNATAITKIAILLLNESFNSS